MEPSRISVIVPIYHAEPYLRQCLDSIIHQTHQTLEIILVDDGSPDHCGEICDEYAKTETRIRVIHQHNQGVSVARNAGIACATGDWLTFVDADDWLEPDMCEQLLSAGKLEENVDIVLGNCYTNYVSAQMITARETEPVSFVAENKEDVIVANLRGSGLDGMNTRTPWGKLYRQCIFHHADVRFLPKLSFGEDMMFNLNALIKARKVAVEKKAYYHYRINAASACNKYTQKAVSRAELLLQECTAFVEKYNNQKFALANQSGVIRQLMMCCDSYFFHQDNTDSLPNRCNELNKLLSREPYTEALRTHNNPYLTRKQKSIAFFAKRKWAWGLWLLYKSKEFLNGLQGKKYY